MKGIESLVAMRMEGRVPSLLYVDLDVGRMPGEGHLQIDNAEPLHSVDLRAVQGLVVSISGLDAGRVRAIGLACEQAGARRVIANTLKQSTHGFEMVEVTDTEGVFEWKQ